LYQITGHSCNRTGKRACPPEDCGGIWGYVGFLAAIRDPKHPEHKGMLEWIGGEFDPDVFDLGFPIVLAKFWGLRNGDSRLPQWS
jgi:Plasmid pRiA4b ORF-3-like protein